MTDPTDLRTHIANVLTDYRDGLSDGLDDAVEAIMARVLPDVDVSRLLDAVATDISRGRNGNMSDRQTAAMLFKIPEIALGLEALAEKSARERAMRSG